MNIKPKRVITAFLLIVMVVLTANVVCAEPECWEADYGLGLNQIDDDSDYRSLGFNFVFYGQTYSGIFINSNGNITLNRGNTGWWNTKVPDGDLVLIAPLYGDFNPYGHGDVYFNVTGTEPNRAAVITWVAVPEFGSSDYNTFQAVLFEGSNEILFGYNGLTTDGINSNCQTMDVGISAGDGRYINFASGTAIPALDETNILFTPAGDSYNATSGCESTIEVVCELKVDEDDLDEQRVAKSLHFKTYNTDPDLLDTWDSLFGVTPGEYSFITLLNDRVVTWEAGTLEMGGVMKIKVKTDKKDPALKEVKIEKAGKKEGTTEFVSGTGGVNPNVADGGWHEVKIKNMDSITVTFDDYTVTGFLKELKVKLDKESTTDDPLVKDFKLKIKGATSAPDVKKGTVTSVVIDVPETVITALGGTEYEEKIKDKPEVLGGHTEAKFNRESDAVVEGVDISSLVDGANDQLKERKGACMVK